MATVYLAEDLKHKRKVAVKVLKPELAAVLRPLGYGRSQGPSRRALLKGDEDRCPDARLVDRLRNGLPFLSKRRTGIDASHVGRGAPCRPRSGARDLDGHRRVNPQGEKPDKSIEEALLRLKPGNPTTALRRDIHCGGRDEPIDPGAGPGLLDRFQGQRSAGVYGCVITRSRREYQAKESNKSPRRHDTPPLAGRATPVGGPCCQSKCCRSASLRWRFAG